MDYNLLSDEDEVEEKLDKAVEAFVDRFRAIQEKHPDAGLGDTHTDEAIVQGIYEKIHRPAKQVED